MAFLLEQNVLCCSWLVAFNNAFKQEDDSKLCIQIFYQHHSNQLPSEKHSYWKCSEKLQSTIYRGYGRKCVPLLKFVAKLYLISEVVLNTCETESMVPKITKTHKLCSTRI